MNMFQRCGAAKSRGQKQCLMFMTRSYNFQSVIEEYRINSNLRQESNLKQDSNLRKDSNLGQGSDLRQASYLRQL